MYFKSARMGQLLFVSAMVMVCQTQAFGMAQGQSSSNTPKADAAIASFNPEAVRTELGDTGSLFRSTLGAIRTYGDRYVQVQNEKDLAQAAGHETEVAKARAAAEARLKELNNKLAAQKSGVKRVSDKIDDITEKLSKVRLGPNPSPQKIQALEADLAKLEAEKSTLPTQATMDELRAQIKTFEDQTLTAEKERFQAYKEGLDAKLGDEGKRALREDGVFDGAKDAFTRMKENYYDAKFLLTDFRAMETQYKLTKDEVELVKAAMGSHLNQTLIGTYVNGQIKKALSSKAICTAVKACPNHTNGISAVSDNLSKDLSEALEEAKGESAPRPVKQAK